MIFMVVLFLAITLIYSSYSLSAFRASAVFKGGVGGPLCYQTGTLTMTCCQEFIINRSPANPAGTLVTYCTDCEVGPGGVIQNCGERYIQMGAQEPTPTPTPPVFDPVPPGVLENLPTLEQVPPTTMPPLFGQDTTVPPTGGIEQPLTTTTPQIPPRLPGGGANVPTEGGSAEQPPTPQDDQDGNQGGGLPTINNQENIPPGGGVAEQPEDYGQEDSSEGAETAGPLK